MSSSGLKPTVDSRGLPRWAQVIAGLLLFPIAIICVVGALTMFSLPNVQHSLPLISLTIAVLLLTMWTLVVTVRLVAGMKDRFGLFGPWALRVIAMCAIGLTIGGIFTGYYVERSVIAFPMAISYILLARRLWHLAAERQAMQLTCVGADRDR
jgi:hypothetical protein